MKKQSLVRAFFERLLPADGDSRHDARDRILLRHLLVAMQAVSLILTWNLWSVREIPPNLPAIDMPALDMGWALMVSLLIVPWRPVAGISLHTLLLVAAIAMDQMRIQPEFISLAILMWGTLPFAGTILLCRAHLVSLWFFAGLHKILSPDYFERMVAQLSSETIPLFGESTAYGIALVMALLEMTIAVLVIFRRTRRRAAWLALFLHTGILLHLLWMSFDMRQIWNVAVWPWNVVLACAGLSLIADWKDPLTDSVRGSRLMFRVAAFLLVVMPIGYYFGVVDAYLAHCLYSDNVPMAWYKPSRNGEMVDVAKRHDSPGTERLSYAVMKQLNVPFPPAHRLYEDFFRRVAKRGDVLFIKDPRAWAESHNLHDRLLTLDGEYRGGKKNGVWVHRFENGAKMSEGTYLDGKEQGPWIHWLPDGRKEGAGTYRDGEMHGAWQIWYEDGRQKEVFYDQGKLVRQTDR